MTEVRTVGRSNEEKSAKFGEVPQNVSSNPVLEEEENQGALPSLEYAEMIEEMEYQFYLLQTYRDIKSALTNAVGAEDALGKMLVLEEECTQYLDEGIDRIVLLVESNRDIDMPTKKVLHRFIVMVQVLVNNYKPE